MRKAIPAAVAAALLAAGAAPAAASIPGPPLDPVTVDGGGNCGGEACTPRPYTIEVDKTYPSRLIAWADTYVLP